MPSLFSHPAKIKRIGAIAFGIPAKKTCPSHGRDPLSICATCYADKGFYKMPNVQNTYQWRYELTQKRNFAEIVNYELEKMKKRPKYFRIHDSGDFYSTDYLCKWYEVVRDNPDIHFYCYTKEVHRFKSTFSGKKYGDMALLPDNWTVCFSYGGLQDDKINPDVDRHSFAFPSREHLLACGYVDASHDDLQILDKNNHRIGLVEH